MRAIGELGLACMGTGQSKAKSSIPPPRPSVHSAHCNLLFDFLFLFILTRNSFALVFNSWERSGLWFLSSSAVALVFYVLSYPLADSLSLPTFTFSPIKAAPCCTCESRTNFLFLFVHFLCCFYSRVAGLSHCLALLFVPNPVSAHMFGRACCILGDIH